MNSPSKLYRFFERDWSEQFSHIYNILPYLESYPEYLKVMEIKKRHTVETIWEAQKDWIRLVAKLDYPLDKGFFKPHWVPLDQLDYEYFIDLSSPTYKIFNINFFFVEPYRWFKNELSGNIIDLLLIESKEQMNKFMDDR